MNEELNDGLIEIRVRVTSKAHKTLTRRARQFGIDRDVEAGRLLARALGAIFEQAELRREDAERRYLEEKLEALRSATRPDTAASQ